MRTFVREKKIYCGRDFLEVDIYNYTAAEQEVAAHGRRSKKQVESTLKQVDWNDFNSRRRFLQLVNTNFTASDIHLKRRNVSCTIFCDVLAIAERKTGYPR